MQQHPRARLPWTPWQRLPFVDTCGGRCLKKVFRGYTLQKRNTLSGKDRTYIPVSSMYERRIRSCLWLFLPCCALGDPPETAYLPHSWPSSHSHPQQPCADVRACLGELLGVAGEQGRVRPQLHARAGGQQRRLLLSHARRQPPLGAALGLHGLRCVLCQ